MRDEAIIVQIMAVGRSSTRYVDPTSDRQRTR
jgi:hypothetical protein